MSKNQYNQKTTTKEKNSTTLHTPQKKSSKLKASSGVQQHILPT